MASDSDAFVVGLGLGLHYFLKKFRVFRKYWILADAPQTPIRGVASGLVEIHGKPSLRIWKRSPHYNLCGFLPRETRLALTSQGKVK